MNNIKEASELAANLSSILEEMSEMDSYDSDMVNAGLHMLSIYEQLMLSLESQMHPDYRKNIEQFRKELLINKE